MLDEAFGREFLSEKILREKNNHHCKINIFFAIQSESKINKSYRYLMF